MRLLAFLAASVLLAGGPYDSGPDPWPELRRPLHLPPLQAGQPCPVTRGRILDPDFSPAQGRGPVYAIGLTRPFTLARPVSADAWYPSAWGGREIGWIARPEYLDATLIRGRQLDGPNIVRFGATPSPASELRLERVGHDWVRNMQNRFVVLRLRAPGCYGFQVDGPGFSSVIVFRAVAAPMARAARAQIAAAVRRSKARLRSLDVALTPEREFFVEVSARDPAAYLKHRFRRVLEKVNGLAARFDRFSILVAVHDARSDRDVLLASWSVTPGGGGHATWHVDRRLADCARDLPLGPITIHDEHSQPPCPAP